MSTQVVIFLFVVNSVLVLTVLSILFSVLKQGKHISHLAQETQSLARHAEEHVGAEANFEGEDMGPELSMGSRD